MEIKSHRVLPFSSSVVLSHLVVFLGVLAGVVTVGSSFTASSTTTPRTSLFRRFMATVAEDSAATSLADNKQRKTYLSSVPMGAPDPILGIAANFRACTAPDKVDLCVGAYRDGDGRPWILPSVREAERRMWDDPDPTSRNHEYAPITGDQAFVDLALEFAYGTTLLATNEVAGIQTLSGTGACRIGAEFLGRFLATEEQQQQQQQQQFQEEEQQQQPTVRVYLPDPTWGNHIPIFDAHPNLEVHRYRYYDRSNNGLDAAGMLADLEGAPTGSVILLHACAHNPTGCDPTPSQWEAIREVMERRGLFAFFDSAYQGFATGDAEADAFALRLFVEKNHPAVMLAQSFAKNFGLYGERCGTFSVICSDSNEKEAVLSQLRRIVRPMYSSPPVHGSGIVKTILSDPTGLAPQYRDECRSMAERIGQMRTALVEALAQAGSTHDWSHVTSQVGMFAFTGLSPAMCDRLTERHHIYLTRNGRISVAGVNENNLHRVAAAIHEVSDGQTLSA